MGRGALLFGFMAAVVGGCLWSTTARATVLGADEFPYEDGSLTNVSGGKWRLHSGNGSGVQVLGGTVQLDSTSAMHPDDVHCLLDGAPITRSSGITLYARFALRLLALPTGDGGYFAHFKNASTGFRGRVFASTKGAVAGAFRLGVANNTGTPAFFARDLELGTRHTLVLRYEVGAGTSALWLDPSAEGDASVIAIDTPAPSDIAAFALRQSFSSGDGAGRQELDNLVVATSFTEALTPPTGPPVITLEPQSQCVAPGATVTFSVAATGAPQLLYRWRHNGLDLPGAVQPSLVLTNVGVTNAGDYQATVSNAEGSTRSAVATLIVASPLTFSFTNVLEGLIRPGDAATNSLAEQTLRPGEKLTLTVVVTDPAGQTVAVQPLAVGLPASGSWSAPLPAGSTASVNFTMQATTEDAGGCFSLGLTAWTSLTTNVASWRVYVPTAAEQQIVITEYLANPTSATDSPWFNPLKRSQPAPRPSVDDEYLELVNFSDRAVDLEGWTINDAAASSPRLRFPGPLALGPGEALIAYGGSSEGAAPGLNVRAVAAQEGAAGLALNNDGDTINLRNAQGNLVARVVYTANMVARDGSMTRYPDANGGFVPHTSVSSNAVSPGTQFDGRPFTQPAFVAPTITEQPYDQEVPMGEVALFRVVAEGSQPLTYQWLRAESELENATNATLRLAPVTAESAGAYRVRVANAAGQVASRDAVLSVAPALPLLGFAAAQVAPGLVTLSWQLRPEHTYSVWTASKVTGPYQQLATGLSLASYTDRLPGGTEARFYRLSSP